MPLVWVTRPVGVQLRRRGSYCRPEEPEKLSDEEWGDYLFNRKNTKGRFQEQWCHTAGCRQWFNAIRDSQSYKIEVVYKIGEQPPDGIAK